MSARGWKPATSSKIAGLGAVIEEVRNGGRDAREAEFEQLVGDDHQPAGIGVGQGTEKGAVGDGPHGGDGRHAERGSEGRQQGEGGRFRKRTGRVPAVEPQVLEPAQRPDVVRLARAARPVRPTLSPDISAWKSSSSRRRSFHSSRRRKWRSLRQNSDIAENPMDGAREALEIRFGLGETALAGLAQAIDAHPPVAVGGAPFGLHPGLQLEALEGGVERALFHRKDVGRGELDLLGDAVAVKGGAAQGFQDQQVERAGE